MSMELPDTRADLASKWELKVYLLFLGGGDIGPTFDPYSTRAARP
jgi:hypothetical protein